MENLFSNIAPLSLDSNELTILDAIKKNMSQSNELIIAVGYVSTDSLRELNSLIRQFNIKKVTLIVGMYSVSGLPESIYNELKNIHLGWKKEKLGEIFLVNNMNYHAKLYVFLKNSIPKVVIHGSANLSVLAPKGVTTRQYEFAFESNNIANNEQIVEHLKSVKDRCCISADKIDSFSIIHEKIEALSGIENVIELTPSTSESYESAKTTIEFHIPIKAPRYANRFSDEQSDYAKSNINVSYGNGRKNSNGGYDLRNWYETQITVSKKITDHSEYPKEKPFFIVTDDGYMFEAHTSGANKKQFSAYGSDRIFGRWIKGRLVSAGLLVPFDNITDDKNRDGVVTLEMLARAQMKTMILTKTTRRELGRVYKRNSKGRLDKKNWVEEPLDVWILNFTNDETGE
ncbi:NgoFVII family restriction endonuclease [Enterococcus asini]|uniref:restriction endonuclease PLD domain-containing protein n=1 Tax=Enterococcus asini TaxID=57732 RepID=UPI00288C7BC4|nr:restriction endonuclease PLD domain-containing protein [Enterococcus asini]MDT2757988.1 NgoFVII family restriction endonuclease [Enterococcus asini]